MALEVERSSGKYEELWNEYEWVDETMTDKWIYKRTGEIVDELVVNFNQTVFVDKIQKLAGTTVPLTLSMRLVVKDQKQKLIDSLTQTFTLTVHDDPEVVNKCADVTLKPKRKRDTTVEVAFDPVTDATMDSYRHIMLNETLVAEWAVAPTDADAYCPIVYKLQLWDSESNGGEFVEWQDLVDDLYETSAYGILRSSIYFDETSGMLDVNLSKQDMEEFSARFTDDNGDKIIKCKVLANAPSSTAAGYGVGDDQLISTEFNFKFVSEDLAKDCSDNKIYYSDKAADGTLRAYDSVYDVQDFGVAATMVTIPGVAVRPSIEGCPLNTVFEYIDRSGESIELINKDGQLDLDLSQDVLTLDLTIDQDFYFELAEVFGATIDFIPDELHLKGAFVTYDPITGDSYRDHVEILIVGSGQVASDKCTFDSLTVVSGTEFLQDLPSGEGLVYKVQANAADSTTIADLYILQLLISTEIDGLDALTPELCRNDVYMTLDLMDANGIWQEKWSERPSSTMCMENCWSPAWVEEFKDDVGGYRTFNVYVDEWSFVNELQVQRQSSQTSYDLEYRIAFKNGKKEAIDALTQEFILSIDASDLSSENECADATVRTDFAEKTGDQSLAFSQYEVFEQQDLEIKSAYKVKPQLPKADGTFETAEEKCQVKYQLAIWHLDSEAYISMGEFIDELTLVSGKTEHLSKITINEMTGDVHVSITNQEFLLYKEDFFLDESSVSARRLQAQDAYAIKLAVYPVIAGSNTHGPGQTDIKHEFKIKIVDSSTVKTCADNKLTLTELTVLGGKQRDFMVNYDILPTAAQTLFKEKVRALKVHKGIPECETETVAEYYNPIEMAWVPIRDNEYVTTNFEPNAMYIDISFDQEFFINDLAPTFGYWYRESGMPLPQSVGFEVRFRTFDISSPDTIFVNDPMWLNINSNGEKPSSFCDLDVLEIDPESRMSGSRNYQVPLVAGEIFTQQIPIMTIINGWEAVRNQTNCYEMLWIALEFEQFEGHWVELQSEQVSNREPVDEEWLSYLRLGDLKNSRIYFKRDYETDFSTLYVEIEADDFVKKLSVMYPTGTDMIEIPLRIMYYDDERTPIEELSSYFSVKATYKGEQQCSEAVIAKKDQVRSKYEIAFKDEEGDVVGTAGYEPSTATSDNSFNNRATARKKQTTDGSQDPAMSDASYMVPGGKWAHLMIDRPLEIKRENATNFEQCEYEFQLHALDGDKWKVWDELANELQQDTDIDLISNIYVSPFDGFFSMNLYDADFAELRDRFTVNGETYVDLKIVAFIPGSAHSGPNQELDDLPHANIRVYIIDDAKADLCMSNMIATTPFTHSEAQRDDRVEFQIPTMDVEDPEPFTLEALYVMRTELTCTVTTTFEYKNMHCFNDMTQEWGCWEQVRENDDIKLMLSDEEGMKVEFSLNQTEYLEMVNEHTNGVDEGQVEFETRFTTHDPVTEQTRHDYVQVVFKSSFETKADFCAADVGVLSIKENTGMTKKRTYKVGPSSEPARREKYFITNELEGYEYVDNQECLFGIYMTLDVKIANKYVTLWDEMNGGVVHEMGHALWIGSIDNVDYIFGELDQFWYEDRLQTAYNTLNTTISVNVRVTRRDVTGEVIDALTTEFVLEVKDNGEISKCADQLPTLKSQSGDWKVSFDPEAIDNSNNDRQEVNIRQTAEAKVDDETLNCGIYYKLVAFNGTHWVEWDDLVETLLEENPQFTSSVVFDPVTADFSANFTLDDYNTHKDRFTDSNTGKVEMKFQTLPIVPGSSVAGPNTAIDTLTSYGEFKIEFVEPSVAQTCANLQWSLADTFDGQTTRNDANEYTIGTSSTLTIKPKLIVSTADCTTATVTVLEFQTSWGEWKEIRNGHMNMVVDTVSATKKIDFDMDQKDFLEHFVWEYANMTASPILLEEIDEITINCRFKHTAPNGKTLEDPFKIKVIGSGQSQAELCTTEFATLAMATAFVDTAEPRKYRITEKDHELKKIYIPAAYTGYDALSHDCKGQLYRTLDYLQKDGVTWTTLHTEGQEIPEMGEKGRFYFEKENDVAFNVKFQLTHKGFVEDIQTIYEKDDKEITATARLAVRDQDEKVIDALTAQFDIKFIDIEEVSECANIQAFVESYVDSKFVVAFDTDRDFEEFRIDEALKVAYGTTVADDTDVDCGIQYQVQVWDKDMTPPKYVNLDSFIETLKNDWNKKILSTITFDRENGSITGFLRRSEFNDNISRFANADGSIALKLRVVAMVLESTVAGPAIDKDTLPSAEFTVKLLEAQATNSCKQNKLYLADQPADDTGDRESDKYTYQITKKDVADVEMMFYGKKVQSTVTDQTCDTVTILEYKQEYYLPMSDGTMYREEFWTEIKAQPGKYDIDLDPTKMSFGATVSQDEFLETLTLDGFNVTRDVITGAPKTSTVTIRFRTVDVVSKSEVNDTMEITLISSGETEAQRCDFSMLEVTSQLPVDTKFTYEIGESDTNLLVKDIVVPMTTNGLNDISIVSKKCRSQVHMALEYQANSLRWGPIWCEGNCTEGESDEIVYVHNEQAIWALDISQEDFVTGIRRTFELANDVYEHTINMRFVLRDGAEKVIAGTENPFKVTIKARETDENPCADAVVQFKTKSRDIPLAFNQTAKDLYGYDYQKINIPKVVAAEFTDQSLNCPVFYRLQAYWEGQYTDWEDVSSAIETKLAMADIPLTSHVNFNDTSADINLGFSSSDIDELEDDFTDNGVTAIKFQVYVVIPGSNTQGTGAPLADLVSAQFQITYIKPDVVSACEGNRLIKTDRLLSGEERGDNVYKIPKQNEAAGNGVTLEAYIVKATNPNCNVQTETYVQWKDPRTGEYIDVREGQQDVTITAADSDSGMTINFNPTQQYYLEELVDVFAEGWEANVGTEGISRDDIKSITITGRFVTLDPATMTNVTDEW